MRMSSICFNVLMELTSLADVRAEQFGGCGAPVRHWHGCFEQSWVMMSEYSISICSRDAHTCWVPYAPRILISYDLKPPEKVFVYRGISLQGVLASWNQCCGMCQKMQVELWLILYGTVRTLSR
ncbi:hypothetical protein DFH29DRAFT_975993 [Suillus ampliporus]|nr:hypothetical protein DFH29DRAFT_975993 [Suillus ampliporus]